ncbi:MAG: gluconokinase [Psychromonas sp.]|nr:gluconokinase [Psychromonas sp.]
MDGQQKSKSFIIMGVSSTGKSSVGEAFAKAIQAKFIDGDDLHSKGNILKISSGQSLNDQDRIPWLERIRDAAFSLEKKNEKGVIVCSALKRKYRDMICDGNKNVTFIFLHGKFDLVLQRMQSREGHFMPVELLQSQFETLKMPQDDEKNVINIDIHGSFEEVLSRCLTAVQ